MKNFFEVENPDYEMSPYTGMTKKHYIECAKYILERAFKHVDSLQTPISFPKVSIACFMKFANCRIVIGFG